MDFAAYIVVSVHIFQLQIINNLMIVKYNDLYNAKLRDIPYFSGFVCIFMWYLRQSSSDFQNIKWSWLQACTL